MYGTVYVQKYLITIKCTAAWDGFLTKYPVHDYELEFQNIWDFSLNWGACTVVHSISVLDKKEKKEKKLMTLSL